MLGFLFCFFFFSLLKVMNYSSLILVLITLEFCLSLTSLVLLILLKSLFSLCVFIICSVVDGVLGILVVWMIYRFSVSSTGLGVMKM